MTTDDTERDPESTGVRGERATRPRLSTDDILDLLADRRRREILHYFHEATGTETTLEDLAGHVSDGETVVGPGGRADGVVKVSLRHVHLPKLAEVGIVEYDEQTRRVRYRGNERLEAWLERVREGPTE